MIKIRLLEHEIHRNETTFRPFIFAQNTLREVGIEFTTQMIMITLGLVKLVL